MTALVLVVALVVAAAAAVGAVAIGWFSGDEPSRGALAASESTDLPPDLPPVPEPSPQPVLAPVSEGPVVRPREVRERVARLLRDPSVRRHVGVAVADVDGEQVRWTNLGPALGRERFIPASTLKLFTALAALDVLGPQRRFTTSVVATTRGQTPRLVLVGGGDPLLARRRSSTVPGGSDGLAESPYPLPATLQALAAATARALPDVRRVRLSYDDSLFTGPAVNRTWEPSYVPGVVSPISALWVDEGREPGSAQRSTDPARAAAEAFAKALARRGVAVRGPVTRRSGAGGSELARVRSAPLDQLVTHTLELSDNEAAEVLLRHVALAAGRPGSFAGGVAAVRALLTGLGVPMERVVLRDGSGLSRDNRVTLPAVLAVLGQAAGGDARLRAAETGLPVAAFSGSLAFRFDARGARVGRGVVAAKTGTLSGVQGLAGTMLDRDGTLLVFAALADKVPILQTLDARAQLDLVAARLAGCGCS